MLVSKGVSGSRENTRKCLCCRAIKTNCLELVATGTAQGGSFHRGLVVRQRGVVPNECGLDRPGIISKLGLQAESDLNILLSRCAVIKIGRIRD